MTGRRSHGRLSALNGVVHQGTAPLARLGCGSYPGSSLRVMGETPRQSASVSQADPVSMTRLMKGLDRSARTLQQRGQAEGLRSCVWRSRKWKYVCRN